MVVLRSMRRILSVAGLVLLPAIAQADGRVIVKYRSDADLLPRQAASADGRPAALHTAATLTSRMGRLLADGATIGSRTQVLTSSVLTSRQLADELAQRAEVEWAVVDQRRHAYASAPNDPLFPASTSNSPPAGQWYLRAPDSTGVSAIDVLGAWDVSRGKGVVVAVLDTGVRSNHPDLSGQLLDGYDFVSDAATANDGDGWDGDPSDPGDWISNADTRTSDFSGCDVSDSTWHGTQTAGIVAAATGNARGIAGVGPQLKVLPVRVLGKCGGYDSDIIAAMRWSGGLSVSGAPTNPTPAQVINLSLGSDGSCPVAYAEAISDLAALNVTVVAAAGNEGLAIGVPANCSGAVAVTGVRQAGTKVGYSNLGPEATIAAPAGNCVNLSGECLYPIVTTTNSGRTSPSTSTYTDGYNPSLGTSFSTPIVAATIGLMRARHASLTNAQVVRLLSDSSAAFPASGADAGVSNCQAPTSVPQDSECYCTTSTCGAGLLDAAAVLDASTDGTFASFVPAALTLAVGDTLELDGSGSHAASGRSLASYAWSLKSGGSRAHFSGSTAGETAMLVADATGIVDIALTVTDSNGTTSTARRRMAVSASTFTASFSASPSSPTVGETVTLDSSDSVAGSGRTIAARAWAITAGSDIARLSATSGTTVTLSTSGAGEVTVRLTLTDNTGATATDEQTLQIGVASSGGGGGGGALPWGWSVGLLLAAAMLRPGRRH